MMDIVEAADGVIENVMRIMDEDGASRLVDGFAAVVAEHSPNKATAFVALAEMVRSAIPDWREEVWLCAFAELVLRFRIVRNPDGSPIYRGETKAVVQ